MDHKHHEFVGVMAVLDKPNESVFTHFCSEQISHPCKFMHSNTVKVMRISIDDLSVAESEWADESCSDSSCFNTESDAADFLQISDVTKLVHQNDDLAESDVMIESVNDSFNQVPFSFSERNAPGLLVGS
jgi:hypothetical protein